MSTIVGKILRNNPFSGLGVRALDKVKSGVSSVNKFVNGEGWHNILDQVGTGLTSFWNQFTGITDQERYEQSRKDAIEDREYNSIPNQVQLMRDAGLNPDILGVGEGSASDLSGKSQYNKGESQLQALNQILAIASNLQGLKGMSLDNQRKQIENDSAMYGLDRQRYLDTGRDVKGIWFNVDTGQPSPIEEFLKNSFFSGRAQREQDFYNYQYWNRILNDPRNEGKYDTDKFFENLLSDIDTAKTLRDSNHTKRDSNKLVRELIPIEKFMKEQEKNWRVNDRQFEMDKRSIHYRLIQQAKNGNPLATAMILMSDSGVSKSVDLGSDAFGGLLKLIF